MFVFGKMSQTAIAVVSRLAEEYSSKPVLLSSEAIAEDRRLPKPVVGKILTILSRHKIVHGIRGPQGGYRLLHAPDEVSLFEIVSLFERTDKESPCPLGPGWCGCRKPCPLHHEYDKLAKHNIDFLKRHTFGAFRKK